MAADPLGKVFPREPLRITQQAYNGFVDAGNAERRRQHGLQSDGAREDFSSTLAYVRNDTGVPQDRLGLLVIGDPIIPPTLDLANFQALPLFSGTVPVGVNSDERPVVLLDSLNPGEIGRCVVSGVAPVQIHVGNRFANTTTAVANDSANNTDSSALIARTQWACTLAGVTGNLTINADDVSGNLTVRGKFSARILTPLYSNATQWALVRLADTTGLTVSDVAGYSVVNVDTIQVLNNTGIRLDSTSGNGTAVLAGYATLSFFNASNATVTGNVTEVVLDTKTGICAGNSSGNGTLVLQLVPVGAGGNTGASNNWGVITDEPQFLDAAGGSKGFFNTLVVAGGGVGSAVAFPADCNAYLFSGNATNSWDLRAGYSPSTGFDTTGFFVEFTGASSSLLAGVVPDFTGDGNRTVVFSLGGVSATDCFGIGNPLISGGGVTWGANGTFTSQDGKTVTVQGGLVMSIV